MRTTFSTVMMVALAASVFTGCKKDSNGDDDGLRVTKTDVTLSVGATDTVRVYTSSDLSKPNSNNNVIATAKRENDYVDVSIKGVSAGHTTIDIANRAGQKATINVTVKSAQEVQNQDGFIVETNTIFLQKGQVTNLRDRIKAGSGNYTMSVGSTAFADELGNFQVRGKGEGLRHEITFKDVDKNKEVKVPAYVIKPFVVLPLPQTQLSLGSTYDINPSGVYTETTTANGVYGDNKNNRYDRVTYTTSGGIQVVETYLRPSLKITGITQGYEFSGVKIKATALGNASITLRNGDGQTLTFNFTVKAEEPNNYFNIDNQGVLTVKPGVTLQNKVTIPAGAKKIANNAFADTAIVEIDLSQVEEIGDDAFNRCFNLTTVTMRNVKVIARSAFASNYRLTKIDLPATLQMIGSDAFRGSGITEIISRATTPPIFKDKESLSEANYPFGVQVPTALTLKVPAGSEATYKTACKTKPYFGGLRTNNDYTPFTL